jgi:hypothetical protein
MDLTGHWKSYGSRRLDGDFEGTKYARFQLPNGARPELDVRLKGGGNAGGEVVRLREKARGKRTARPGWDNFGVEFGGWERAACCAVSGVANSCSRSGKLDLGEVRSRIGPGPQREHGTWLGKAGLVARLPLAAHKIGGSRITCKMTSSVVNPGSMRNAWNDIFVHQRIFIFFIFLHLRTGQLFQSREE